MTSNLKDKDSVASGATEQLFQLLGGDLPDTTRKCLPTGNEDLINLRSSLAGFAPSDKLGHISKPAPVPDGFILSLDYDTSSVDSDIKPFNPECQGYLSDNNDKENDLNFEQKDYKTEKGDLLITENEVEIREETMVKEDNKKQMELPQRPTCSKYLHYKDDLGSRLTNENLNEDLFEASKRWRSSESYDYTLEDIETEFDDFFRYMNETTRDKLRAKRRREEEEKDSDSDLEDRLDKGKSPKKRLKHKITADYESDSSEENKKNQLRKERFGKIRAIKRKCTRCEDCNSSSSCSDSDPENEDRRNSKKGKLHVFSDSDSDSKHDFYTSSSSEDERKRLKHKITEESDSNSGEDNKKKQLRRERVCKTRGIKRKCTRSEDCNSCSSSDSDSENEDRGRHLKKRIHVFSDSDSDSDHDFYTSSSRKDERKRLKHKITANSDSDSGEENKKKQLRRERFCKARGIKRKCTRCEDYNSCSSCSDSDPEDEDRGPSKKRKLHVFSDSDSDSDHDFYTSSSRKDERKRLKHKTTADSDTSEENKKKQLRRERVCKARGIKRKCTRCEDYNSCSSCSDSDPEDEDRGPSKKRKLHVFSDSDSDSDHDFYTSSSRKDERKRLKHKTTADSDTSEENKKKQLRRERVCKARGIKRKCTRCEDCNSCSSSSSDSHSDNEDRGPPKKRKLGVFSDNDSDSGHDFYKSSSGDDDYYKDGKDGGRLKTDNCTCYEPEFWEEGDDSGNGHSCTCPSCNKRGHKHVNIIPIKRKLRVRDSLRVNLLKRQAMTRCIKDFGRCCRKMCYFNWDILSADDVVEDYISSDSIAIY